MVPAPIRCGSTQPLTGDAPSLFGTIDSLGSNVPDATKQALKDGVRDLNTISGQSFINNTVGPFQRIGDLAGRAAAIVAGLHSGSTEGIVGGLLGRSIGGRVGSVVGAGVDRALGTNTPPVMLQRINAERVLRGGGIDPNSVTGNSVADLQALRAGIQMPAPPVDTAPSAAQAAAGLGAMRRAQAAAQLASQPAPQASPPPFIRPQASLPEAPPPAPAPPFIRPQASLPEAPAPVQANPAQAAAGLAVMRRAQAAATALQASGNAPDPVTGNRPDPVPVNTPIRATAVPPTPAPQPILPPLRTNSLNDVAQAIAQDDGQPVASVAQRLQQAQSLIAAGSGPQFTPGSRYIANGVPGLDHAGAVTLAQGAEQAGKVPPGTADLINTSRANLSRALLDPVVQHGVIQSLASVGIPQGGGVRNPLSYAHNLRQEGDTAANIVATDPSLAGVVNQMRDATMNGKTKAGRRQILSTYLDGISDPAERARQQAILEPLAEYGQ